MYMYVHESLVNGIHTYSQFESPVRIQDNSSSTKEVIDKLQEKT